MSQRRFAVMGDNIFLITKKLCEDQDLCRLLKYTDRDPLSITKPDIKGLELLNKNILIVPKLPDELTEKENFVVVLLDSFRLNDMNPDFKTVTIRFDIACQFDKWLLNDTSLRPYLLAERIDNLFNEESLAGIGNLRFRRMTRLVLSPQLSGYTLEYIADEFN